MSGFVLPEMKKENWRRLRHNVDNRVFQDYLHLPLATVLAAYDARPLEPGDRVTFPFGKGEVFEVLCVYGDWVVGVGEDGIPTTLSLGAVERTS